MTREWQKNPWKMKEFYNSRAEQVAIRITRTLMTVVDDFEKNSNKTLEYKKWKKEHQQN